MAYIPAVNAQVTNEMPARHFLLLQNADFSSFPQSRTKVNKSATKNHTNTGFLEVNFTKITKTNLVMRIIFGLL